MIKRGLTIITLLLSFNVLKVYAGWYECYNFKGTIGNYPITLSVQVDEGYFGEKDKKDFNIIGVYKYDQHNEPISLEGKIDFKTNKALLYEVSGTKHSALFEFQFSKAECDGTWKSLSTNKLLPLHLNFTAQLLDTTETNEYSNVEILQSNSLKDFYFTGVYSKKKGEAKAQMDLLKIIRKKDNSVFQTIDFSKVETQTGNVYTIIYANIPTADDKTNQFQVSNNIGKAGGLLTIKFNAKTRKFKLNLIPEVDGPG